VPVPVTVATQVAVCAVVMEDGVATTVTAVTVDCATGGETATTATPTFAESSTEMALIVSAPEAGGVVGAA